MTLCAAKNSISRQEKINVALKKQKTQLDKNIVHEHCSSKNFPLPSPGPIMNTMYIFVSGNT